MSSDLQQVGRHVGQHLDAVVRHQHVVLDPNAAPAGEIRAGLDREDHPGRDRFVAACPRPARRRVIRGSSCTSMPRPWPVPWPNASPSPCAASASRAAASMANRDAPGRDRRDGPVVRLEDRRVDLAGPLRSPARPTPSGSSRRSMSRRRRRSPARPGRLRLIFARRACACGSAAFGPAGDNRVERRPLEPGLPDARSRSPARPRARSVPARTSASTPRGDRRQPPRRFAQRLDLVRRPCARARARRAPRSARARRLAPAVAASVAVEPASSG